MGGTGSVPGQDTKILHAIRQSQKQTKDCRYRPLKASTMHRSLAKFFFLIFHDVITIFWLKFYRGSTEQCDMIENRKMRLGSHLNFATF